MALENNQLRIDHHNQLFDAGQTSYRLGENQFTNISAADFIDYFDQRAIDNDATSGYCSPWSGSIETPDAWDWRKTGEVGPVVNQGAIGSSIPFSVVDSVAGAFAMTEQFTPLSYNQVIDCHTAKGIDDTFNYVVTNGLESAADYGPSTSQW